MSPPREPQRKRNISSSCSPAGNSPTGCRRRCGSNAEPARAVPAAPPKRKRVSRQQGLDENHPIEHRGIEGHGIPNRGGRLLQSAPEKNRFNSPNRHATPSASRSRRYIT